MKRNDYFIPYGRQLIDEDDIASVIKTLKSEFITQGPEIEIFENEISKKVSAKYSTAVNSGTSALHLACLALGTKKGDIVWTSPISFVASANCALYCGADIDFVDIDKNTGRISTIELERKLRKARKNNKLPKLLIVVHLAGTACDMEGIYKLSLEYKFEIIEDASHALGGKYKDNPIGNCRFSKICTFSFHPVKIITTGEGGLITTNDELLDKKIKDFRSHGIVKDKNRLYYKDHGPWYYEQQRLGFNYRMTDIQASLGISQLKKLDSFVQKRNTIYNYYLDIFSELPIKLNPIPDNTYSSLHLAIVSFKEKLTPKKYKIIFNEMRSQKIGVQLHYNPIHLNPYYKSLGFKEGQFPEAEIYSYNNFSIPLFSEITFEEANRVKESLIYAIERASLK